MFVAQKKKTKIKTLYFLKRHTTQRHEEVNGNAIIPVFIDGTGNVVKLPKRLNSLDREDHAGIQEVAFSINRTLEFNVPSAFTK